MKYILTSIAVIILILLNACEDPHERYKTPEWLKGDNINTLMENGNYNHFLTLMDKADYRTSIENQLFTLFVPSDSAFEAYMNERGIDSIGELNQNEAEELFGLHILINPRSRNQLLYEYMWGQLETPEGEYGSLFLRKETYSIPKEYTEIPRYDPNYPDDTLLIYTNRTYIPFFTSEFFSDYYGDPNGSDYLFMYPGSNWSGTQWHDAMVTEAEVRTSSGFIYYLDRVVKPIPSIDKYLQDNQDSYGIFYDLAQRFASYGSAGINEYDERIFNKSYNQILNFANELGPGSSGNAPTLNLSMYTAFVPYDNTLQDYLNNTILKYYSSIDSVPELYWVYLLQSHLDDRLNIISRIEKGFKNYFGDEIDIDVTSDIATGQMCSNGVIYSMNRVIEPNVFSCVPGPILYNKEYSTFLYAINQVGLLNILSNTNYKITLFAPTDDQLYQYGITHNTRDDGSVFITKKGTDGIFRLWFDEDISQFVQDHYCYGEYNDLSGEGFIKMASGNYIYYNNNLIYGAGNFISGDNNSIVEKIENDKNGVLYNIDNVIKEPLNVAQMLLADPDYSSFTDLLYEAELLEDSSLQDRYEETIFYPRVLFIAESDQWTVFAPDNQAISDAQAAGIIPAELEALQDFLEYHFMRESCVFDDGVSSGSFPTQRYTIDGEIIRYSKLNITNTINNLQVQDNSGQIISVLHENANTLAEFAVIHKISNCLKYE
ncbi:fasciclin domain-containing protein [Bacteroidota bacterium]